MVSYLRILFVFLATLLALEFFLAANPDTAHRMIFNFFLDLPDGIKRWAFNNLENINVFSHILFVIFSIIFSYVLVLLVSLLKKESS